MKKILLFVFITIASISNAQQTAMQISGLDCNSNPVDLFADLNSGKAAVVFFYMANCSSCPPPAQEIQSMANVIMNTYPGMVKGFAFPFNNSTTCAYSSSWVSNNGLSMYAPLDSGAIQVAYYGGFGMPTVVLLGGTDHRVMFSTQSYVSSDTTIMRDSILNLLTPAAIHEMNNSVASGKLFPSPATDKVQLELTISQATEIKIDIYSITGELVSQVNNSTANPGVFRQDIPTSALSNGTYFVRVNTDSGVLNYKFSVVH